MPTPSQLEQGLQANIAKRSDLSSKFDIQNKLNVDGLDVNNLQAQGVDRLNQTINAKAEDLKVQATATLLNMAKTLGITGLGTDNLQIPENCPTPAVIQRVIQQRDNLLEKLTIVAQFLGIVDVVLRSVSALISGTETALQTLSVLKIGAAAAANLLPSVPGTVPAALSAFDDIRTIITFKKDGNPRLPGLKRGVDTGASYITRASLVINSIILLLKSLDFFIEKCGGQLPDLNSDLQKAVDRATAVTSNEFETSYKGFTFQIVEEPFTPTVNRRIGQALNSEGIVLLQTDASFTTNPQVLIEELKLVIDRDNLKAN